jgi:hypothetical protein
MCWLSGFWSKADQPIYSLVRTMFDKYISGNRIVFTSDMLYLFLQKWNKWLDSTECEDLRFIFKSCLIFLQFNWCSWGSMVWNWQVPAFSHCPSSSLSSLFCSWATNSRLACVLDSRDYCYFHIFILLTRLQSQAEVHLSLLLASLLLLFANSGLQKTKLPYIVYWYLK